MALLDKDMAKPNSAPSARCLADVAKAERSSVQIKKQDDEQQLVFGEVYAPTLPDSQGDFMTSEEIQKMAYEFMRRGLLENIDVGHTREASGCYVVESFIARDWDPTFIPGSWVLGVQVVDPAIWAQIKSGELNGFSLDGSGVRVDTILDVTVPEYFEGQTSVTNDHDHPFVVSYGKDGGFLGGRTVGSADHFHEIVKGTATEEAGDPSHSHRFSFLEGVINAGLSH
jgi:Putative phage serine protease XkdF